MMSRRKSRTAAEILNFLTDINTDDSDGENDESVEENFADEELNYNNSGGHDEVDSRLETIGNFDSSEDESSASDKEQTEEEDDNENAGIDEALLDRTSKDSYVWKIMKEREEKRTRNRSGLLGKTDLQFMPLEESVMIQLCLPSGCLLMIQCLKVLYHTQTKIVSFKTQ